MEKIERRNNIIGCFTYMAGAGIGPGRVRLGGKGKTFFGELDGRKSRRCEKFRGLFAECGLEAEQVPDIISRLWSKVLVYAAINPLSAILRVKNGHLLEKMESISLAKRLIDEGKEVAESHGASFTDSDLYELFFDTCQKTSGNISSMLLDLIMGRRTEIDALNGEIFRLAQEKMLPASTHLTMTELVKLGEKWGVGFQKQV
jgi:2-dehydropantoate 2-reductase